MDSQLKFENLESIKDLTNDELRRILEYCGKEEKLKLIPLLKELNQLKRETIEEGNGNLILQTEACKIFLKRCWRNLEKEEKIKCAKIFKEIENRIDNKI